MAARYDFKNKDLLLTIEGMVRDGATNKQVAEYLRYSETYFCELLKKTPELSEVFTRARRPLTVSVENSLYRRAIGMKVKTVTKRWMVGPDGKQTDIEIIQETESEVPPDPKAIAFWLTQRKPEVWNKQPQKIDVTTGGNPFLELIKKASEEETKADGEN